VVGTPTWGATSDGSAGRPPYNDDMTTITTEAIPTTSSTSTSTASRTRRYLAAAVAAVALSVGAAAGISAATDHGPASPSSSHTASTNDQCPMFAGKPC
jgi:hypothetical protein